MREGDFGHDDLDVGELRLDLRLLLERVDHPLLEVVAVALHVLPGLLVRDDRRRLEVLVAQDVAAVMVRVDDVQEWLAAGQPAQLIPERPGLVGHHRRVDDDRSRHR